MSVDKLVDSTQLNADLTSVANAIRAKSGGSSQLAFPAGFVSEIQAIPSGETVYYSEYNGAPYIANVSPPPAEYTYSPSFRKCPNLKSLIFSNTSTGYKATGQYAFAYNDALETVVLDMAINSGNNNREFQSCKALKTVQLGGIGKRVNALHGNFFAGCSQNGLTITVYVDDAQTIPLSGSPWGAYNATIIYKSTTDGSVRTP